MPEKRCRDCGLTKPTSEFYADARAADGHERRCKVCKVARARARRAAGRGEGGNVTRPQRSSSSRRPRPEAPWGRSTPRLDEGIESAVTVATASTEIGAALRSEFRAEEVESISMLVCFGDVGGEADE